MDIDISNMFNEENKKIFFRELKLNLNNNTEALDLSCNNIVRGEFAKLVSALKKLYMKYSIKVDKEKLKEILSEGQRNILADLNTLIQARKERNIEYLDQNENININKKFINAYNKYVDLNCSDFISSFRLSISEQANKILYGRLSEEYPCTNDEMHNELFQQINNDFVNTIINRTESENKFRDQTLQNMTLGSYEHYMELNTNTINNKHKTKTKIVNN